MDRVHGSWTAAVLVLGGPGTEGTAVAHQSSCSWPLWAMAARHEVGKTKKSSDEDITSMDATSPIRWSWSSTYFRTAGKHLLATVVTASYGFQFGSSTTPWKDHQVYFEMDPASCEYLIRVIHNH
jgi:hypothetical protein